MKLVYQRHLPHQIPEHTPLFLTWNLKGAIPREILETLERERERLAAQCDQPGETPSERRNREGKILFAAADRFLDGAHKGPLWLKNDDAAKIVEDSILFGTPERYELFAWCVMANHVHVLLTPRWELKKITQGIKGFTAHEINGLQNARSRVFWQDESYDHWVRDEAEMHRIIEYIENNPVQAGLCKHAEDWRHSSAKFRVKWKRGEPWSGAILYDG